jgi:hypothetical protein
MGRALGFVGIILVMAAGMYIYSDQLRKTSAIGGATTPTGVAQTTGVNNDLISIANAERGYFAAEGKYGSLDDLISGNYITIERARPPYTYSAEAGSRSFQVTATRNGPGEPARIWIDESMQIQSSN